MAMDFGRAEMARAQGIGQQGAVYGGPVPTKLGAVPYDQGPFADAAPGVGTESERALAYIGSRIDQIDNQARRLSSLADRLVGPRPRDVEPEPSGAQTVPTLQAKLNVAGTMLDRVSAKFAEALERLETFI